jgi:hypothetical protein
VEEVTTAEVLFSFAEIETNLIINKKTQAFQLRLFWLA